MFSIVPSCSQTPTNKCFHRTLAQNMGGPELHVHQPTNSIRHCLLSSWISVCPLVLQKLVLRDLFVRVARLQNEFRTKYFIELRIFLRRILWNFPRIFWAFILWVQVALKGHILKGDIWIWDFALQFALENGISLCNSHATRQFSLLFLREFHREGAV